MKKKLLSFLLTALMICNLTACQKNSSPNTTVKSTEAASTTRIFTDDCDRKVEIPQEISRIASSGPVAQMLLFAIAPEKLVGLSSRWSDTAREYISSEFMSLPYLGQLYDSSDLNIEELALAAPQLIIDIGEPKKAAKEDLDSLQTQTAIPSVYVSATLETMPETFRTLGKLLNKEEKGEKLAAFCEKVYDRTISIMEKVGEQKVNALYVLGEEGLNVIAAGSYHAELLDMMTNNLAVIENPSSKGLGNEVSMEQIALWNPDLVIFAPGSIYDTVDELEAWSEISAITTHNYLEIPEGPHNWMGNPPSVQRYLALIWLTAGLYPDYCDYDVRAEIMEYYELFYHCRLTDKQYETLTQNAFTGE